MHTVFALLCFVVVIHWLLFPYPPGLLCWHCGNLTIAPVPAKQSWWIWINTSCEIIMIEYITTTKQSTTKLCAYLLGYTVYNAGRDRPVTNRNKLKSVPGEVITSIGFCGMQFLSIAVWVSYSISQEICTRFCCALLCCGYAIVHNEFTWSIYPHSSGLLCWHWGNR